MSGLAILCSGQGRQTAAFFRDGARSPEARTLLHAVMSERIVPSEAVDWLTDETREPPPLFTNELAQPLICLGQLMIWETIRHALPAPDLAGGYSLGELTACGVAGCWSPVELVKLAARRGQRMSAAAGEAQTLLAVLGLPRIRVEAICREHQAHLAIVNGADHVVVGLKAAGLASFEAACQAAGAGRVVRLPVSVAAHTPLMDPAARAFEDDLRQQPPRAPVIPLISSVTGDRVFSGPDVSRALRDQIRTTVDWQSELDAIGARGCRVLLELGPGDSLARMARQWQPDWECRSVAEFKDPAAVAGWVRRKL